MRRVIDRQRRGEKLDYGFRRLFLIHVLARFKAEHHHRDNVVAAADAAVTSWVVAAGALAGSAGNAGIGQVASIRPCARYQQQENGNDTDYQIPVH